MVNVVRVEIVATKSIVFVSNDNNNFDVGEYVILQVDGSSQVGVVKSRPYAEKDENVIILHDEFLRKANDDDLRTIEQNKIDADKALADAKRFALDLKLPMNFIDSYYAFDRSQLLLYFNADDRIDFRELAKKLAQKYKTRIELRQIGVRDKAKRIGGLGPCGLFLCCNSFLTDFNSVSINMAKNQFLALNPSKINGVCGRLFCCLGYENDLYTEMKKKYPKVGSTLTTKKGAGKVTSIDIFRNVVAIDLKENGIIEIELEELTDEKN